TKARVSYGSPLSLSADGRFVTSGVDQFGPKSGVSVWDLDKGVEIGPFPAPGQRVGAVLAPGGKGLATWDMIPRNAAGVAVQLWDVATVKEAGEIRDLGGVSAVAFSPDGRTFAAAGPATVALIERSSGKERLRFATRYGPTSAVFSPDGK